MSSVFKIISLHIFLIATLLHAVTASAQSWEQVKGSSAYLWGEGWGSTVAEADKQALNDLISKIAVHVTGNVTHEQQEVTTNNGIEANSTFSTVVNTYSNAYLTNTAKEIIENEPDAHVGRWIKRSEISRIFEGRKNKISDYISSALKAESRGKIDVALKDLYWALALTKTLQDPNEYRYVTEEGESLLAMTWIPRHINEIFDNIDINVTGRRGDDLELMITYHGKPVNSVDYTYFDGRDWSNIYSARDGVGVLELAPGCENEYHQLKFEYEYRGESHIDPEVQGVLNSIKGIPMRSAYKSVKSAVVSPRLPAMKAQSAEESVSQTFASVPPSLYAMPPEVRDEAGYQRVLDDLAKAIVAKQYDDPSGIFTPEAKDIYDRLIKYGKATVVGQPKYTFYKDGDHVIARGLQMSFQFNNGMRKSFVEEVIFAFDAQGKICNISFGLGKTAEADILGKGVWDERARFAIMNFLENYQTAYALKRLDYISTIFDDDAVIITGSVTHAPIRRVNTGEMRGLSVGGDIIRYNRHTKDSYLRHLKRSFDSKEYINLRLADNEVRKLGKGGEMYAIQISQEYYSSNYGDKGYLFLMVDINDPECPIIKVRTWQPEKDPDFGIYGPEHFK